MREIIDYFAVPHVSFWRWEDNSQLITWWDGRTIAFKPEVVEGLQLLATRGLPPFGALLLLYAACRQNWEEEPSRASQLDALCDYLSAQPTLLDGVAECLQVVHEAWKELRDTPNVKARLAYAIFDTLPGLITFANAQDVSVVLGNPELLQSEGAIDNAACRASLVKSLGAVYTALHGVTVEQLCLRVRTGVDQLPQQVLEETQLPQGTTRELLTKLEDDDELAGLARLAKMVLATLNLPRAVSDPDDLPDGGLSDITNRGSLDRLLLSELAHDDLTLSVRIALREALYLRREVPPRTPHRQRTVLIDCGLRLWGVPRMLATAVGLAIAAASEGAFEVTTWRTAGDALDPADFSTRAGLAMHLEALDYRAHPGPALEAFATQLKDAEEGQELVLITSEDVLGDHEFLSTLSKLQLPSLFIATVNREGRYRLQARSAAGMRLLKEANFNLEDVLGPRRPNTAPLMTKHTREALPAIFGEQRFPLLLSAGVHPERAFHHGKHVYSLTRDGRLLRWTSPDRAGEQIAEGLPAGHVHWVDARTDELRFVVGPLRKTGLHLVNMSQELSGADGRCDVVPLRLSYHHPKAVAGYAGTIFVNHPSVCEAFDATTGRRLGEHSLELGMTTKGGRFYSQRPSKHSTIWYGMAWQGGHVQMHRLRHDETHNAIVAVIDAPHPVVIRADARAEFGEGDVWDFAKSTVGKVVSVSRTGRFFIFLDGLTLAPVLVDLELRRTLRPRGAQGPYLEPLLPEFARPRVLRHRFRRIGIDRSGKLVLFTPSGDAWPIHCAGGSQIVLPKKPANDVNCTERIDFITFEGAESPYSLQIAKWPNGSQAVLDGRGLLHLRAADATTPECTIVLCEGETAGWVSDGRFWGPKYFLGDHRVQHASAIWDGVIDPFMKGLQ